MTAKEIWGNKLSKKYKTKVLMNIVSSGFGIWDYKKAQNWIYKENERLKKKYNCEQDIFVNG